MCLTRAAGGGGARQVTCLPPREINPVLSSQQGRLQILSGSGGACSRRRSRSAVRRSLQATMWPATSAPSSWPPSTTPSASSSLAASPTSRSLPPGALERRSRPRTKSASSSAGSSKTGLPDANSRETSSGRGAPACAQHAGAVWVGQSGCGPAHVLRPALLRSDASARVRPLGSSLGHGEREAGGSMRRRVRACFGRKRHGTFKQSTKCVCPHADCS